jgi:ribulose 1,5-bisphosphate synthetase/thiazole synthase
VEISYKPDVLVVGGGPAGIGAALGAARTGAGILLIENYGFFGGIASFSIGMNINQMRPRGPRSDVHELVIKKLLNYGDPAIQFKGHSLTCNVEYLKVALFDALDEVGCKYLVHTRAVDAIVENNHIVAVVIATKRGPAVIRAKAVVDCTGDADIAYFAGAETPKEDDALSPMTLILNVTNVDMEKAARANIRSVAEKARQKYPLIPKSWGFKRFPSSNTFMINHHGTQTYSDKSDTTVFVQLPVGQYIHYFQCSPTLLSQHRSRSLHRLFQQRLCVEWLLSLFRSAFADGSTGWKGC